MFAFYLYFFYWWTSPSVCPCHERSELVELLRQVQYRTEVNTSQTGVTFPILTYTFLLSIHSSTVPPFWSVCSNTPFAVFTIPFLRCTVILMSFICVNRVSPFICPLFNRQLTYLWISVSLSDMVTPWLSRWTLMFVYCDVYACCALLFIPNALGPCAVEQNHIKTWFQSHANRHSNWMQVHF